MAFLEECLHLIGDIKTVADIAEWAPGLGLLLALLFLIFRIHRFYALVRGELDAEVPVSSLPSQIELAGPEGLRGLWIRNRIGPVRPKM